MQLTHLALITLVTLGGFLIIDQGSNTQNLLQQADTSDYQIMREYTAWKSEYNQNFNSSEDEYRFNIFSQNYKFIQEHNNSGTSKNVLGLTGFAAMTNEEYREKMLQKKSQQDIDELYDMIQQSGSKVETTFDDDLPSKVDWQYALLPSKDQGGCGSCWAFATIGVLEPLRYLQTGIKQELSAQQLVDCMPKRFVDAGVYDGCQGSEAPYVFMLTSKYGIQSGESYPYVSGETGKRSGPCRYDPAKVVFKTQGMGFAPKQDVLAMQKAITQQPISVDVNGGSIYFQLHKSGIIDNKQCSNEINHLIVAYGYNIEGDEPYWMVQNSWGSRWGDNGFGKIAITKGDGICGIQMVNVFPTLANTVPENQ